MGLTWIRFSLYIRSVMEEKQTMPRQLRIDYPGAIHPVMSLGKLTQGPVGK